MYIYMCIYIYIYITSVLNSEGTKSVPLVETNRFLISAEIVSVDRDDYVQHINTRCYKVQTLLLLQ
jgi:hypothetical protein